MTLYSLFTRNGADGPDAAPQAVAERFSWFAFLLPPVYALVHRLWLAFLGLVVVILALGFAGRWLGGDAAFWLYGLMALWFGFEAPAELVRQIAEALPTSAGYSPTKGLLSARNAVVRYYSVRDVPGIDVEHVFLGNGASELIVMAMQGLLNSGDEVLVPAPDYPLWTAAVSLAGGNPVHYVCDEQAGWLVLEHRPGGRSPYAVVVNLGAAEATVPVATAGPVLLAWDLDATVVGDRTVTLPADAAAVVALG